MVPPTKRAKSLVATIMTERNAQMLTQTMMFGRRSSEACAAMSAICSWDGNDILALI